MFLYGTHTNASICLLSTGGFVFLRLWTFVVFFFTDYSSLFFSPWLLGASPSSTNRKHAQSFNSCHTHASRHFAEICWCLFAKSKRTYIKDKDDILSFFTEYNLLSVQTSRFIINFVHLYNYNIHICSLTLKIMKMKTF